MEKQLFAGQNPVVITDNLEGIVDRIEKKVYVERLSDDELSSVKDEYIQCVMQIDRAMEELEGLKAEYNERLKPIREEASELMEQLRLGVRKVEGNVYTIFNHDKGIAGEYSPSGKLIKTRPMLPTERQTTIKLKAVNNG